MRSGPAPGAPASPAADGNGSHGHSHSHSGSGSGGGHGHSHEHDHRTAARDQRGALTAVLGITVALVVVEVVGGILGSSLALLADAGHLLTDAIGIGVSLVAVQLARRPATPGRTFGLQRAEILAAAVNGVLLLAVGVFVFVEAVQRLMDPPSPSSGLMAVFGLLALAGNGVSLLILRRGQKESLNVRGAFLEVASDALGAAAVVVAAVVIATTGFTRADPVASLLIAVLIVPRTLSLLREAVDVLLEATPRGVDLVAVRAHVLEHVPCAVDVHDLHAWTITSGSPVLSAHVVVDEARLALAGGNGRVLDELQACLSDHFDVAHCTFQLEPAGHREHEGADHA